MKAELLLVLDFDGVVCDSLAECLVSSWIAYYHLLKGVHPLSVPIGLKDCFYRMRSFIRSGEDYVLIQHLINSGQILKSQSEFDTCIASHGKMRMKHYKEHFYRARTDLLNTDRHYWLSLNRVYPHMRKELFSLPGDAPVRIISTKKTEFIVEILKADGISMNPEHVCYSGERKKLSIISEILDKLHITKAIFIDDQIDHLKGNVDPRIDCHLPSWGFIQEEWLDKAPVISPEQTTALFARLHIH